MGRASNMGANGNGGGEFREVREVVIDLRGGPMDGLLRIQSLKGKGEVLGFYPPAGGEAVAMYQRVGKNEKGHTQYIHFGWDDNKPEDEKQGVVR